MIAKIDSLFLVAYIGIMAYESGISPNSPELDKVLSGLEKCNPDELKVVQAAVARMLALIEQPPPYGGCVQ